MVAVVRQQVVARAGEGARDLHDDSLDLAGRAEGQALEEGAAERAAGRLKAGWGAVDAGEIGVAVSAESEFAFEGFDDDAGVKEGGTEKPEGGGDFAGLFILSLSHDADQELGCLTGRRS